MTDVLGLHRINSVVTLDSIEQDEDTRKAYRQFCKNLHQIGVTEDMIRQKENEVLGIFRSPSMAVNSTITNQLEAGCSNAEISFFVHLTTNV